MQQLTDGLTNQWPDAALVAICTRCEQTFKRVKSGLVQTWDMCATCALKWEIEQTENVKIFTTPTDASVA